MISPPLEVNKPPQLTLYTRESSQVKKWQFLRVDMSVSVTSIKYCDQLSGFSVSILCPPWKKSLVDQMQLHNGSTRVKMKKRKKTQHKNRSNESPFFIRSEGTIKKACNSISKSLIVDVIIETTQTHARTHACTHARTLTHTHTAMCYVDEVLDLEWCFRAPHQLPNTACGENPLSAILIGVFFYRSIEI